MELFKIKVTVAGNSFEAEGVREAVVAQFEVWRSLVTSPTSSAVQHLGPELFPLGSLEGDSERVDPHLLRVFQLDPKRGLLTLKIHPEGHADAILLALYGLLRLKHEEEVSGTRLMQTLKLSGVNIPRIDRGIEGYKEGGFIIRSGYHKGTKYRITATGCSQAEGLLKSLVERLPTPARDVKLESLDTKEAER
jgi:hypothetical protein